MLTIDLFGLFLKQCWEKSPLHSIRVSPRAKQLRANTEDGKFFRVSSLQECLEQYYWNSSNYETNEAELKELSFELRTSIHAKNNEAIETAFKKIYSWGKVSFKSGKQENISSKMLNDWSANQTLGKNISDSVQIVLTGKDLQRFNGSDLFMNSGYTKVVSLASDPKSPLIIYDGRVGAALGHLVTLAMNEGGYRELESELLFPWGEAKTKGINRNPSNDVIKFPRLFAGAKIKKNFRHAEAMHISSKILNQVSNRLSITPRELEAALFMWGYAVD